MAGTIPAVVDESLLICGLCGGQLSDPRMLPCLHTFCHNCLTKHVKSHGVNPRHSDILDLKIVEEALKGGLDREIPVHGYDDVIGNDSSLPWRSELSTSSDNTGCNRLTLDLSGYSQVPDDSPSEEEKSHNYHEIPENTLDKHLLAADKGKKKRLSRKMSSKLDQSPIAEEPEADKQVSPPSYLPMNHGTRSKSEPVSMHFEFSPDVTPQSQSARTSHVPGLPGLLNTSAEGLPVSPTDQKPVTNTPVTYESMTTSSNSDTSYELGNSLTGYGLTSPVSMAFFQKVDKCMKRTPPEPIYELEKPIKASPKSNKKSGKLSKKTSKSVGMLSFPVKKLLMKNLSNDNIDKPNKSESEGDNTSIKSSQTAPSLDNVSDNSSNLLTHSISTPYMLEKDMSFTECVMSNIPSSLNDIHDLSCEIPPATSDTEYSEDLDGYVKPLNKRNPPKDISDSYDGVKEPAPVLPPKRDQDRSPHKKTPDITKADVIPKPEIRPVSAPKRRKAVGASIMSAISQKDRTLGPESVFDSIYEEIQCDDQKPQSQHTNNSSNHGNKVPLMTPITSTPNNSNVKRKTELTPKSKKVQNILSKASPDVKHTTDTDKMKRQPAACLKLGGKLARKSQYLLDKDGFAYITDGFEKVQIQHDDEEFELIYEEVHGIEDTADDLEEDADGEFACPLCASLFPVPKSGELGSSFKCSFLENLLETHKIENELHPLCKNCSVRAEYKCLDCDNYLCKKCHNTHNWSKVVKGHKVMSLTQLQSGMYTNQIMIQKQLVCPNHSGEQPTYYCDTCNMAVCKECSHCYHNSHKCQLIDDIAKRGVSYLQGFSTRTQHLQHKFTSENMQVEKYMLQYKSERQKIVANITNQYVRAQELLEQSYRELVKHIDVRFTDEGAFLKQVQECNQQFLSRIDQTNKLADHVTEYGSPCDVIEMTQHVSSSLLAMEKHEPTKIDHKMELNFSPLSSVTPVDILPLIGQTTRMFKPIRKRDIFEPMLANESKANIEKVTHMHSFSTKTHSDQKGCKPTGITLTRDDSIVLVDDINKKIKIFTENGDLIQEIVPKSQNELVDPWDISVTNYGNYAVTDRGSKQVKIFDPDGDLVCHFGPHLANPWGICCNNDGDLIVTDTDHKCVFVHDSNGNVKYRIDPPATIAKFPEYVTTNSFNDIIVSDLKAHCIYVFNILGQFLFKVGPKSPQNSKIRLLNSPCGVYCDQEDNILVTDYELMRVTKFDKNGHFHSHFLTFKDNLRAPQSLTVNHQDHVILLDGNCIKIFHVEEIEVAEEAENLVDLELKPKRYNRGKKLAQAGQEHTVSDGEDDRPEFQRAQPLRKTVHTTSSPRTGQRYVPTPVKKNVQKMTKRSIPATTKPMKSSDYDVPSSNKVALSCFVPEKDATVKSFPYDIPSSSQSKAADRQVHSPTKLGYDSPSVKEIKEKLSSLDSESREGSPEKAQTGALWENQEAVSVDKVKKILLNKNVSKPKIQPKPDYKLTDNDGMNGIMGNSKTQSKLTGNKPKDKVAVNTSAKADKQSNLSINSKTTAKKSKNNLRVSNVKVRSMSPANSTNSERSSKSPEPRSNSRSPKLNTYSRSSSKEVKTPTKGSKVNTMLPNASKIQAGTSKLQSSTSSSSSSQSPPQNRVKVSSAVKPASPRVQKNEVKVNKPLANPTGTKVKRSSRVITGSKQVTVTKQSSKEQSSKPECSPVASINATDMAAQDGSVSQKSIQPKSFDIPGKRGIQGVVILGEAADDSDGWKEEC